MSKSINLQATEELEPNGYMEEVTELDEWLISFSSLSSSFVDKIKNFQTKLKRESEVGRIEVFEQLTPQKFAEKISQLEEWAYSLSMSEAQAMTSRHIEERVGEALTMLESMPKSDSNTHIQNQLSSSFHTKEKLSL